MTTDFEVIGRSMHWRKCQSSYQYL